jgi:hypothetical protein
VRVLLLKWAALTHLPNFDHPPRRSADIDILICESDFQRTRAALQEVGFHLPKPLPDLTDRELVTYAHTFDQIKFLNGRGVTVDAHFRILNMGLPTADDHSVWARSMPVQVGDSPALLPSPEDLLLHLCFHANHHGLTRVYQLCEIVWVYDRFGPQLNWDYLSSVVRQRKMMASFFGTLRFAFEVLEAPFPADILDRFKPAYARRKLFESVWNERAVRLRSRFISTSLEGPVYYLLEMDNLSSKLRFITKSLFPPLHWIAHDTSQSPSTKLRLSYLSNAIARRLRYKRFDHSGR